MRQQFLGLAFGVMISAAVFLGLWQPWEDDVAPIAPVAVETKQNAAEIHAELCERHLDRISQAPDGRVLAILLNAAREDGCG